MFPKRKAAETVLCTQTDKVETMNHLQICTKMNCLHKILLSFHLICPVSSEECYEKFTNIMVNYKYIHTRGYNYCGSIPLF